MKVCILSDSHDNIPVLKAAVSAARDAGAEAVLHCGDVVAPSTLAKVQPFGLPVHVIHGNNTGDLYALSKLAHAPESGIEYYGMDAAFSLGGQRIFLVHYPHYAKAMALTGDYDVVCCGHTHRSVIEPIENVKGGTTVLINPGTVGGVAARPTYVMGDLDTLEFDIVTLPDAA